jgi:biopolymer transport protein ExbB
MTLQASTPPASGGSGFDLASLFDMVLDGGPIMIPIGLCSVVALAYVVERSVRLRRGRLGTRRLGNAVVAATRERGAPGGLELLRQNRSPLGRVLAAGLQRAGSPYMEREMAAEDAGRREVKRLSANLRPLVVVAMIAPLLGLLGTVWGMIEAFSAIAVQDGLGRPELLAEGISQALITTAAGLAVAIPTQAAYYYFKSRIDRWVRLAEDVHVELHGLLDAKVAA